MDKEVYKILLMLYKFVLHETHRGDSEQAGSEFLALGSSGGMASPGGSQPAKGNRKSWDSEMDAVGKKKNGLDKSSCCSI